MATLVAHSTVRTVAVIGTGTIGSGWAALFVARGFTVVAYVRSAASEAKFNVFLQGAWNKLLVRGIASDPEGWRAVRCERELVDCVRDADYVQESVIEELALKQEIIQQIDACAPPHVIIGSSSSFIPLSLIRARAKRYPERCATVHPTLPQWDDFVEIFGASPEYTAWLSILFGRHVGMDAITLRREMHGHVHNWILNCISLGSTMLVKGGFTSAEEMDRALVHLARLIIASGGISGALVGVVGNGHADAQAALTAEVTLNAPATMTACVLSWTLPARIAAFFLYLLTAVCSWYTRSPTLKRWAVRFSKWCSADFYAEWDKGPGATRFEQRALHRMCKLKSIDEAN
ncbi:MAG: hypothetical protein SGPRY_012718 [Prymnesium sp.]